MASNTTYNAVIGTLAQGQSDAATREQEADHITRRQYVFHFNLTEAAEDTLLAIPVQADITLTGAYLIAGTAITADASHYATLTIGKAAGVASAAALSISALDALSTTSGGTGDLALGERSDFTIVPSTDTLTAGQMLTCALTTPGSGVVNAFSVVVEYDLSN
jgi:hypothetical protein